MKLGALIDGLGLSQHFILRAEKAASTPEHPQGGARVHSLVSVAAGYTGTSAENDYFIPADQIPKAIEAARKAGDTHGVSVLEACLAA